MPADGPQWLLRGGGGFTGLTSPHYCVLNSWNCNLFPSPLQSSPNPKAHKGLVFPHKGCPQASSDKPSKSLYKPEWPECSNQSNLQHCICWVLAVYRAWSCVPHILNPEKQPAGTVVLWFWQMRTLRLREISGSCRDTQGGCPPHTLASEPGSAICYKFLARETYETNLTYSTVLTLSWVPVASDNILRDRIIHKFEKPYLKQLR